jgi:hypothetical protein|tara:strand:+ start:6325 stop:6879 length:555 start_codon:yes stop_codon:yes gene_type:complete
MNVKTISIIGASVAFIAILSVSYISAFNSGNRLENRIKATYTDNQNVLSSYSNKVAEAAQIPAMQRDDLTKVVTAALNARYGETGSKAMFQWIQEQNPTIDSSVYTKLQQIIESGRNDFQLAQTKLIDQKRTYETQLGSFWRGTWLGVAGYPKVDLDTYKVVIAGSTRETFRTGNDNALQLITN